MKINRKPFTLLKGLLTGKHPQKHNPSERKPYSRVSPAIDTYFHTWRVPRHLQHRGIIDPGEECLGCPEAKTIPNSHRCDTCICFAPKETKQKHPLLGDILCN